jgi:hypothetical protein
MGKRLNEMLPRTIMIIVAIVTNTGRLTEKFEKFISFSILSNCNLMIFMYSNGHQQSGKILSPTFNPGCPEFHFPG